MPSKPTPPPKPKRHRPTITLTLTASALAVLDRRMEAEPDRWRSRSALVDRLILAGDRVIDAKE